MAVRSMLAHWENKGSEPGIRSFVLIKGALGEKLHIFRFTALMYRFDWEIFN